MTLTKADLIDSTFNRMGLSKAQSAQVIEALLEIIKKTLEHGDGLSVGLGNSA